MVCLPTERLQEETLEKNYDEIVNSKYNFAVISGDEISSYYDIEQVYGDFPSLYPGAIIVCGTKPLLIDIGEKTNSLEYRIEKNLKELNGCYDNLESLNKRKHELRVEREKLIEEKNSQDD